MSKKIAIIYLAYHVEPFWEKAKKGFLGIDYPKESLQLIIVDNPHPEYGSSSAFLSNELTQLAEKFSNVLLFPQKTNTGFAGGMNIGIKKALELGAEYIFLHNQDGFLAPDALTKLINAMENDTTIGAAQALMRLYPKINLINSSGNYFHYLGFGYSGGYRKEFKESDWLEVKDVGYASGGALMLRADVLIKYGLLEEAFESYHEDLEYSLRLHAAKLRTVLVGPAHFFHEYNFSRNKNKYYLMERNRSALLLMYYRLPTLLLLAPLLMVVEIGIYIQAIGAGWLKQKIKASLYWSNTSRIFWWMSKRSTVRTKDRAILKNATAIIKFEGVVHPFILGIMNVLFSAYFWLVKLIVWW